MTHQDRQGNALTPPGRAISETGAGRTCKVCRGPLGRGKRNREFCSPRCRLLKWGAEALLEAHRAGQVDGLRDTIRKIAEVER